MTPKVGNLAYETHTEQTKGIEAVQRVVLLIVNPNAIASYHAVMIHSQHASNHVLDTFSTSLIYLLITNPAMMSSGRLVRTTLFAVLVNVVFLETIIDQSKILINLTLKG